jgi:beta-lactam-binding protein with PASTA domain
MAFNVTGFLIGKTFAEREGIVEPASVNRVALIGGVVGPSATGLLLTTVLARREAESIPPVSPAPVELVQVPDFKDHSLADAQALAVKVGLIANVSEVRTESSDGVVIDQAPPPNSRVALGDTVTLFVAKVVQPPKETRVMVPNVTNQPFAEARETLQDEDFRVSKKLEPSDDIKPDFVIRTEPPAELVAPESRVTVFVSSGPKALGA